MSLTSGRTPRSAARRAARGLLLVGALAAAFAGGVVTGVAGAPPPVAASESGHGGLVDEAAARIEAHAARSVGRDQLEQAAVEGMLSSLGDRWSSYHRPAELEDFSSALDGRYSGVGLWLRRTPTGGIEVTSVQPASPAAVAGLRAGDLLVAVDTARAGDLTVGEAVQMLRGERGTRVVVRVQRGAAVHTVTLTRTVLSTADVTVEHLRGQVLRIRVAAFTRGVGRQVRDALNGAAGVRSGGIVLDLRDNPGGLLHEAVEVASAFLDGGRVVSYDRRGEGRRALDAYGRGDVDTPLVVLVDGGTASAAEIVAAALQDRNRAVVVGSRTFGKGSVQEETKLSDGSALELTVGRYFTPSGRVIDGVGLEPDVLVDADRPAAQVERRAMEVLSGLIAGLGTSGRG